MKMSNVAKFNVALAVIRVLAIWLLLFIMSRNAQAQTTFWVEERVFIIDSRVIHRVDGLLNGTINTRLGSFVWFQVDSGYAEAYGGITFSPKPWVQMAVGPGLEQADNPARIGGYLWLGKDKISFLFIPEYGGSGFWTKAEFNQGLNNLIGVGVISERFKGTGPRIEVNISKLKLWAAPLWHNGNMNSLVGVRLRF